MCVSKTSCTNKSDVSDSMSLCVEMKDSCSYFPWGDTNQLREFSFSLGRVWVTLGIVYKSVQVFLWTYILLTYKSCMEITPLLPLSLDRCVRSEMSSVYNYHNTLNHLFKCPKGHFKLKVYVFIMYPVRTRFFQYIDFKFKLTMYKIDRWEYTPSKCWHEKLVSL